MMLREIAGFQRGLMRKGHRGGETLKPHEAIRPKEGLAMIKILFITGLVICGIAAGLLLMGKIESGVAAVVGIVGMGLMGSSAAIVTPSRSLNEKKGV
jgi:hypothetical protein